MARHILAKNYKKIPVFAINMKTNDIIKFDSIREASKNLLIPTAGIKMILKKKKLTYLGYTFKKQTEI